MKKQRSISLFVFGLALTLVMYNCKKSDPLEPDQTIVDKLNDIKVAQVTIAPPAAVTTTPSSITASAKATETATGIASISATGVVPASVTTSATQVSAALSPTEVATMAAVTPATFAAVAAGGALPADLKSVLDKASADPALKAFLPSFTLPTVNGKAVPGRQGASVPQTIAQSEGLEVSDECIAKAEAAFATAKVNLDASKATQIAAVEKAYQDAIAPISAAQATCTGGIPAKYAALDAAAKTTYDATNAALDANQALLGSNYALLKALNSISYLGYLSSSNTLQAADVAACTAAGAASTTAAQAARTANTAAVEAAYQTALAAANTVKTDLIKSCHNQGGGN
ncbi:hypothetical protein [Runella sp.]|uniref:hypothetical protein n=1 Tax=Runella sp. TaxID=1960881 RepID=UPI003D0A14B9